MSANCLRMLSRKLYSINLIAYIAMFISLQVVIAVELPDGIEDQSKNSIEGKEKITSSARSEVSILCYHDFSSQKNATEMRIHSKSFAEQMQALADSGINVISLSEFESWKSGQKKLPPRNVVITIDDGWLSVYEEAYPVLKKHGFPFALGLYTDFINSGGRTLTNKMIAEMRGNGMEIMCHSASHPFPSKVKAERNKGEENYQSFLNREIRDSKKELDTDFSINIKSYVYPGGFYLQDMFSAINDGGMSYAFTVKPGKVTLDSSNMELPRYVVLGTTDRMFTEALKFSGAKAVVKALAYPVKPSSEAIISERQPIIGIDLSSVENLDKDSVYMRVAGFGKVNASFVKETSRFEWHSTRILRLPSYKVFVQWRKKGASKYEPPIVWKFYIGHESKYLELIK